MKVSRKLLRDDVIENKIVEMQVKYLDCLYSSHSISTDWLVENNQIAYSTAPTPEEQETLIKNVEGLKKNQDDRLRNTEFFKTQIEFLQSILAMNPDDTFEINTTIKDLIV